MLRVEDIPEWRANMDLDALERMRQESKVVEDKPQEAKPLSLLSRLRDFKKIFRRPAEAKEPRRIYTSPADWPDSYL